MAMTERVVVMLTTQQKEDVSRRAAAEQLSLSGYIRQQALGDDELLSVLLDELTASTTRANASLDRTLANLEESERRWPEIEAAARERAMAEFSGLDPTLFAQMIK
jgi:hypothetical protein